MQNLFKERGAQRFKALRSAEIGERDDRTGKSKAAYDGYKSLAFNL
jgi:hypothetical protein